MTTDLQAVVINDITGALTPVQQAILDDREDMYLIVSKQKKKKLAYTLKDITAIFLGEKHVVMYKGDGANVITFGILGLLYRAMGLKYLLYEKPTYAGFFRDSYQTNKFYRLSRNNHPEYEVQNFYDTDGLIAQAINFDFIPNNSSASAYTHTSVLTTFTAGIEESIFPNNAIYGPMVKLLHDALTTFKAGIDVHVQNDIRLRPEHVHQTLLNCLRGIDGTLYAVPDNTDMHWFNATPLNSTDPDTVYSFDIIKGLVNYSEVGKINVSDIGQAIIDVKHDIFHVMLINATPTSALTISLQDYVGILCIKTGILIPDNFKVPFNITHTYVDGDVVNNSIGFLNVGPVIGSVEFYSISNSQVLDVTTQVSVHGGTIRLKTLANTPPVITLLTSPTKTQEEIDVINASTTAYIFEDGETYNQTGVGYWMLGAVPLYTLNQTAMTEFLGLVAKDSIESLPDYNRRRSVIAHGDTSLEGNFVTGNVHYHTSDHSFIFHTDSHNLTLEGLVPVASIPVTTNDAPSKLFGAAKSTPDPDSPHTLSVFYSLTGNTYQSWDKGNSEGFELYRSDSYIPPESISMTTTHGVDILTVPTPDSSRHLFSNSELFLYPESQYITDTYNSLGVNALPISPGSFLTTTVYQIFIYYLMDTAFNILEYCEVRMTTAFHDAIVAWGDTIGNIMSPGEAPNIHAALFKDIDYTAFIEQGGAREDYAGVPLESSAEVKAALEDTISKYNIMVAEGIENIIHNGWMTYEWMLYYTRYNAASGPEQYIIIE